MDSFFIDTDILAHKEKERLLAGVAKADDPLAYLEVEASKIRTRLAKAKAELADARVQSAYLTEVINSLYELLRSARALENTDLPSAILKYEQGLELCKAYSLGIGHQRACWERLFILYRKVGRLRDEEAMLLYSLAEIRTRGSVPFSLIEKSEKRLAKCRALINKNTNG